MINAEIIGILYRQFIPTYTEKGPTPVWYGIVSVVDIENHLYQVFGRDVDPRCSAVNYQVYTLAGSWRARSLWDTINRKVASNWGPSWYSLG